LFEIVEMTMQYAQYHMTRNDPCLPHWPNGAWSVYAIDGDQIADRVVREKVNPKGWYEGKVIARHSWCGYLGMTETWEGVQKLIEDHQAKLTPRKAG
jgi:hypothetical protein